MVARQFAPGRAVAVAIVAMFLITLLPMPSVTAQGATVADIFVVQGQAQFFQTTFGGGNAPTSFIESGRNLITMKVPVYQTGSTSTITNVPVYWYLYAEDVPFNPSHAGCAKVDLSAQGTGGTPGSGTVPIGIDVGELAAGAYNVSVHALTPPHQPFPACTGTGDNEPRKPCGGATPSLTECITRPPTSTTSHKLRAYFIKDKFLDLRILGAQSFRWCPSGNLEPECDTDMVAESTPYNVTEQTGAKETFFEVDVRNVGNWSNLTDYGGPNNSTGDGWRYEFNVTISGPLIQQTNLTRNETTTNLSYDSAGGVGHFARSANWSLLHKAGRYTANATIDPLGKIRKSPAAVVTTSRFADVMYRDYTGNITASELRTDPSNPYPYDGSFHIAGHVTFRNIGTADKLDGSTVKYVVYIDNLTNSVFNETREFTPTGTGADGVQVIAFDFNPTSTAGNRYIPAGRHTLHARIDCAPAQDGNCYDAGAPGSIFELNESNNNLSVDILIADESKPSFTDPPKMAIAAAGSINLPARSIFHPHEPFNVYVNATDDDAGLNVLLNFTLASNASVYRVVNAPKTQGVQRFTAQVRDFKFHNFTSAVEIGSETWTWRATANDSLGNSNTSANQTLKLVPWPIHTAGANYTIDIPLAYPDARLAWDSTEEPTWIIRVQPNMTGFWGGLGEGGAPNQQEYVDNLALEVHTARNGTFHNIGVGNWSIETQDDCLTNQSSGTGDKGPIGDPLANPPTCRPDQIPSNNTFKTRIFKDQEGARAGIWNYSVQVKDVANYTRYINGTLTIVDSPPTIHEVNLSIGNVTPGQNFTLVVNATDDNRELTAVHVNFSRVSSADGAYVNLTLTNESTVPVNNVPHFVYNQTFKTGRRETFGLGGMFNVTAHVSDVTGNWAQRNIGFFNVTDDDVPQLTEYGVIPEAAQIGENVTFWAKARDTTNVTVRLEVFRGATTSEVLFTPVLMNESADGNFTFTTNFTGEGSYAWRMSARDSVNRVSTPPIEGSLGVRDNVGPRFEVRSPSLVIEGVRYASGAPRIEIIVRDVEGVSAESIDMRVAGQPVDFTLVPAPGNLNGFLVSYEVRAARAFPHREVVSVNLTATDTSSEALKEFLNFTFTVDATAPIARLSTIAPAYRDQPAHVTNVSLNSRFTLTADDNDGLPTTVDSIRFRILGGGPSAAETVYTGPFKINDAPGVYTGPRLYQIQFWAEDAVGNFNRNFNTTTVYVDDTPPALFQFFPQGRSINATFVDDRVGVNRSVVWFRVNSEPYVPLPLVEMDGAWALSLPEGVKGDRVSYYLQAWDRLENTETFGNATAPYASFDVSNHEPKIRITAPVDGGRVFRTVDLTWEASDEDGDALVFTIYYKAPGRATFVELAKIENSATRRYTIDTTRFPDGEYTLRLAAGDGGFVKLAETTVTVLNRASAVGVVSVSGNALPGESMLIKAEITKAEAVVEARLFLAGELVDSYPMNDEGKDGDEAANDGFYSVRVPIDSAGDYTVEIFTRYQEDGELKETSLSSAATFSAKLTPGYILTQYGAIIALIGLLAAVGIGVAVFVVMRRR